MPRGGAALKPILRTTPNCRIFIENDHQRLYAAHFERSLKALGVTVDLTVWKDGIRKHKNPIEYHLAQLQRFEILLSHLILINSIETKTQYVQFVYVKRIQSVKLRLFISLRMS